ncbi:hypothetical protein J6590_012514 [Homalodisca vitripennis]|nr:hypothetical protein J6590_012514 [Homalodisca vitripennis]
MWSSFAAQCSACDESVEEYSRSQRHMNMCVMIGEPTQLICCFTSSESTSHEYVRYDWGTNATDLLFRLSELASHEYVRYDWGTNATDLLFRIV